jgi:hypothetical protein
MLRLRITAEPEEDPPFFSYGENDQPLFWQPDLDSDWEPGTSQCSPYLVTHRPKMALDGWTPNDRKSKNDRNPL